MTNERSWIFWALVGYWFSILTPIVAVAVLAVTITYFAATIPNKPEPESTPVPPNWELIACSECGGDGKVTYGPDHQFVELGLCKPGEYGCPMCGGEGELYLERRK